MNWQNRVELLYANEQWHSSIEILQATISKDQSDRDAYLCLCFLLVKLLGEKPFYNQVNRQLYETLALHYFQESYQKFSYDAEYLYFIGKIAVMGEWFFNIEVKDYDSFIKKAAFLNPTNLLYKEDFFWDLAKKNPHDQLLLSYAQQITSPNSPLVNWLKKKSILGSYILGMKQNWAEKILKP